MKKHSRTRALAVTAILAVAAAAILFAPRLAGCTDAGDPAKLGAALGVLSLLPPVLAVALAFILRDVVISLAAGFLSGAALLAVMNGGGAADTFQRCCAGVLGTVTDRDNAAVLLLVLVIGGMVEVIRASGGFDALAHAMTRRINTPKKANLIGEALGILVFFDDYANSLIVGPVLRPVTDRLGVSREKLAFLVDSTAAPVTGIAVVSSWVAVEISIIGEGLADAGMELSAYSVFLESIPYCFYCLFCLIFIFESSLMGREYGPMLKAERRARTGETLRRDSLPDEAEAKEPYAEDRRWQRIVTALLPILVLCGYAFLSFYTEGRACAVEQGLIGAGEGFSLRSFALAVGSSDTIYLVMKASMLGSVTAIACGSVLRLFSVGDAVQAWLKGASTLLVTAVILALAWSLAATVEELGTAYFVVELISVNVAWWLVPSLIFLACCVVSYAAGSFGCMFIVMPMAIPIAVTVMRETGMSNAHPYFLSCVASVISGSIFGDHCSPVTDCTILSSIGSGCSNMDHVRTQMPYAVTVAGVSLLCGLLPVALGMSIWLALPLGCAVMAGILRFFGKKP